LNFAMPVKYFASLSIIDCSDSMQINAVSEVFKFYNGFSSEENYQNFDQVKKYVSYLTPCISSYRQASEIYTKYSRYDSAAAFLTRAIELSGQDGDELILLYKLSGDAFSSNGDIDSAMA